MNFVRIKGFIWRMLLSMMKSRLNFLIVLSQDIQAGRNILILSPVWFLSERAKLESCQKSTRSNYYGSEDSTSPTSTTKSHGKWLFKLRAGPLFAQKKKNCHCFRIQHCEIARSSWSGSTKQMNCILLSLLCDDTMGANISNQNLNVLAVKKCENMTVVSKHLISVLSYRHWTLVRGDLRASSISTKTMRATNACGWKSGMRSLNHSLNHVLD